MFYGNKYFIRICSLVLKQQTKQIPNKKGIQTLRWRQIALYSWFRVNMTVFIIGGGIDNTLQLNNPAGHSFYNAKCF